MIPPNENIHSRTIPLTIKLSAMELERFIEACKPTGKKPAAFARDIILQQLQAENIDSPPEERVMMAEAVATIIAALSDKYTEPESLEIARTLFLTRRSFK